MQRIPLITADSDSPELPKLTLGQHVRLSPEDERPQQAFSKITFSGDLLPVEITAINRDRHGKLTYDVTLLVDGKKVDQCYLRVSPAQLYPK